MAAQPEPFDRAALRQWAGDKSFQRGEEYFREGRVRGLKIEGKIVTARVNGRRPYKVRLWGQSGGGVEYSCDCPDGREGKFCRHCVAVGLAWLTGDERGGKPDPLREYLKKLSRERLVELMIEATDYDSILRRRLTLENALHEAGSRPEPAAWKKLIREAIATKEYIDYEALPDYAQGIEEVLRPLPEAIGSGAAALGLELCEFALAEMDKVPELVDFSDPALAEIWQQLHDWHLRACRLARPDPVALARRLLKVEMDSALGNFRDAATTYATLLGEAGLRTYSAILEEEWTKVPPILPGERPASIDERRVHLTAMMEKLVSASQNVPALVAVKSRDLSTPHDFLGIAELYRQRGRGLEAIAWCERGWEAFKDRHAQADDLRELLPNLYFEAGRPADALRLAWDRFAERRSLESYHQLLVHARRAGEESPAWTERAIAHLREQPPREIEQDGVLTEVLLGDGRAEEAWEVAQAHGSPSHLWLKLAEQRERRNPSDAVAIYRRAAEGFIAGGSGTSYRQAAEYISRIRRLMEGQGRPGAFEAYRAELRETHKSRRPFVRLLDAME